MINWRPVFALFEQSLRMDVRAGWLAAARTLLLGVILFSLYTIQDRARFGMMSAAGLLFFQTISWTSIVGITMAAIGYFSGTITEDKENKSLGLLRMTDLSPVAILLGKSTGRLVTACLLIAMTIPFLLLAVTLGGVALRQIAATYVCLISYLVLAANIGLLWSVIFSRTSTASALTVFTLLMIFAVPPFMGAIAEGLSYSKTWIAPYCPKIQAYAAMMLNISPFASLYRILSPAFSGSIVGAQALLNLLMAALFFALSWLLFDVCNRSEKEVAPFRLSLRRRTSRTSRTPSYAIGASAIAWKDLTYVGGGSIGIAARVAGTALIIGISAYAARKVDGLNREVLGALMIFIPLSMAALNAAMDTERMFGEEVKWKTLTPLMLLPYSPQQMVRSKAWYPARTTLPILAFIPFGVLLVPDKVGEFFAEMVFGEWEGMAGTMLVILCTVLFFYLTAFYSIILKRAAAMMAIVTFWFAIPLTGGLIAGLSYRLLGHSVGEWFGFSIAYLIVITGIVVLHRLIPARMADKARSE